MFLWLSDGRVYLTEERVLNALGSGTGDGAVKNRVEFCYDIQYSTLKIRVYYGYMPVTIDRARSVLQAVSHPLGSTDEFTNGTGILDGSCFSEGGKLYFVKSITNGCVVAQDATEREEVIITVEECTKLITAYNNLSLF